MTTKVSGWTIKKGDENLEARARYTQLKESLEKTKTDKVEKKDKKKGVSNFIKKFLVKGNLKNKDIIKSGKQMTVVIPKEKPSQYVPIHMKPQWENEKKSFLMR